jgi:hypothetical protein
VLIDGSKLAKEYKQWWFEEMPLIGLYGRQNEGVDQLGFISLDLEC